MTDPVDRLKTALAGRYRVERELGAGGMATVYLAEDLKHRRHVALKVLRPELAAAIGPDRFLREIEVTARLQHPHILPLFDSGDAGGLLFYVMPFVEGESLRDRLDRDGRLPVDQALAIAGDVAAALTFAHGHGVIHRDIKPANILLEDGEGLVADFGIALAAARVGGDRLTATGLAIGTPAYMSPEQISGEQVVDGRSDVYSLGCVLFEMLTGAPPFTGPSVQAIVGQSLGVPAPGARSRLASLPPEVDAALARALAKDPADRFATPRELVDACAPVAKRGPGRIWVMGGALAAAALVAAVAVPLWRSVQTEKARTLLPAIAELARQGRFVEGYEMARQAEQRIPSDTTLRRLLEAVTDVLTITTEPAGADVYLQRVPGEGEPAADSVHLGVTPVADRRVARADYRVVVRKDGHATLERIASSAFGRAETAGTGRQVSLSLQLPPADSVPAEMVAVPGGEYTIVSADLPIGLGADLEPFLLDRYEVSNAQYAAFLRSPEFAAPAHWTAAREAGLGPRDFVDATGLPGPRSWVGQEPPAGTERHPANGVSWYEAAAFCAAAGKRLPSLFEWEKGARDGRVSRLGVIMPWGYMSAAVQTERRANFAGSGPAPVDAHPFGVSPYGVYGMAGNVKEWLANPVADGYAVAGGSWQDPAYLFTEVGDVPAAEASAAIGFRCARPAGAPTEPDAGARNRRRLDLHPTPPAYRPVDAATFQTLLSHYRYDRRPANRRGVDRLETADWLRERFWIDGLGGDSVLVYLYLPTRAPPPFQTLVYIPSSGAFFFQSVWESVERDLGPHIKAGRAVLAPVLDGMIERPWPPGTEPAPPPSVRFRDLMVRHATEMRLGIDYLETRDDIDPQRLAYIGLSLGAGSRLGFAAVDDRFRAVVLIGGGIDERVQPTLPEAANFNFAPYIRPPKLLINGRQDEEHPWVTRAEPLWKLLREPKELVLIDGVGHHPPVADRVGPINAFLDRTLGPVGTR